MNDRDERDSLLATENVGKLLKKFAVPLILTMSASAVYTLIDAVFLGHKIGADALSALTVCLPLVMLISAFGALCNVGVAPTIARLQTKGEQTKAINVFGTTIIHYILVTLLITVGGYLFMTPLLKLTGASAKVLPYAIQYMQVYLLATLPMYLVQGMTGIMRVTSKAHLATRIQMNIIITNVLLDAFFIFALDWGMMGAALAAVICNFGGAIVLILFFSGKKILPSQIGNKTSESFVHFESGMFRYNPEIAHRVLKEGVSPFLISLGGCVVVTTLNQMLIKFGKGNGDTYLCAYMIVYCITQILIKCTAGLGQAMSQIASFNYHTRKYNRVRMVMSEALASATIIMIIGYAVIAIFPNALTSVFTSIAQGEIGDICATALRIGLCTFPFVAAQMMVVAFFQSIGKRKLSMFISLSRQMIFLFPMLIILPRMIGVEGAWWSMCLADIYSVSVSWGLLWMVMKNMHESYEVVEVNGGSKEVREESSARDTVSTHVEPSAKKTDSTHIVSAIDNLNEEQLRELAEKLLQDKESLQEQLEYKTTTDYLTGLLNRSTGEALVGKMLNECKSGMFVMFDCDRFKSINDTISHEVGDIVLKEVARALKETFPKDICFRLGGDEFAACLCGSSIIRDAEGNVDVDATFAPLRQRLSSVYVPELGQPITLSGGAVCFTAGTSTFQEVYRMSDKALQESKKKFHNGVVYLRK